MPSLNNTRPQPTSRPVAVDLFSGAGGISLGLEQAGFEVGSAVEFSHRTARTHIRNFPRTPVLARDIRNVTASDVLSLTRKYFSARNIAWNGAVTLCAGGPPCQGYSDGGKRDRHDERNDLIHDFRRLVVGLKSRYFVMENVPGILRPANERNVSKLINSFERAGYTVADPYIVDASSLGLPQSRRRVLFAGWLRDEAPFELRLLDRARSSPTTVREAIGDLPEIEQHEELLRSDSLVIERESSGLGAYAELMASSQSGYAWSRAFNPTVLTGCARTVHDPKVVRRFAKTLPGKVEPISRYQRLSPEGVAPTLRAGTGPDHGSHTPPRPIHYSTPRVISVREAARIQSFPDWFTFAESKWHAWREIGNAVPPLLSRAVGTLLIRTLGISEDLLATNGAP